MRLPQGCIQIGLRLVAAEPATRARPSHPASKLLRCPCGPADPPLHSMPRSDDSATKRRKAAEARLRDFGEPEGGEAASGPAAAPAGGGLLPSAAAAFTDVNGPPAFLDPEVSLQYWVAGTGVGRPIHRAP